MLRIVPAAELHTEQLISEGSGDAEEGEAIAREIDENGIAALRTNRETVDDASSQQMTLDEIEALKQGTSGAGKDIIAQLLRSHSALDQKTEFSLAKYTLRKRKKYLKRFSVLPLDVPLLTHWMLEEKDAARTLELRDEMIGLIGSWANVHYGGESFPEGSSNSLPASGRWLVVDDTGGLIVAAMAERMGILYPSRDSDDVVPSVPGESERSMENSDNITDGSRGDNGSSGMGHFPPERSRRPHVNGMSARNNTLTVLHPNAQPNLTLLKYFCFDITDPTEDHPLYTNLKSVSWLQLLEPSSDTIYANEPPIEDDATLASWKASKRGLYHRKRRRWARVRNVVNETRAGGFDGLVVAATMDVVSVLRHLVPLLAGAAPVVVYSPHVEPLVNLADLYSTSRRTAYLKAMDQHWQDNTQDQGAVVVPNQKSSTSSAIDFEKDFPIDPSLLISPTLQTSRVRPWQVLPGRTHPMMTGRGGAEGYIFHAIRAVPAEGRVEARGKTNRKKRKIAVDTPDDTSRTSDVVGGMDVDGMVTSFQ